MRLPQYSKREIEQRRAEVAKLRNRAVREWNRDRVGATALVLMTFAEYLQLKYPQGVSDVVPDRKDLKHRGARARRHPHGSARRRSVR